MSFGVFLLIAFILVTIFLIINPQLFKKKSNKKSKVENSNYTMGQEGYLGRSQS